MFPPCNTDQCNWDDVEIEASWKQIWKTNHTLANKKMKQPDLPHYELTKVRCCIFMAIHQHRVLTLPMSLQTQAFANNFNKNRKYSKKLILAAKRYQDLDPKHLEFLEGIFSPIRLQFIYILIDNVSKYNRTFFIFAADLFGNSAIMPFWVPTKVHSRDLPSYSRCFWPWVTTDFKNLINSLDAKARQIKQQDHL